VQMAVFEPGTLCTLAVPSGNVTGFKRGG